jgi:hypothetical protein
MITKISKEGWEKAYYGKWLKAQDKTRRKVKWNKEGSFKNKLIGWKDLIITAICSYCYENTGLDGCSTCAINVKDICPGIYQKYVREMRSPRINWKRANELVDKIVEAIRQDGEEWGYLDKNK